MNKKFALIVGAASLGSLAIGTAAGYIYARRQIHNLVVELVDEAVAAEQDRIDHTQILVSEDEITDLINKPSSYSSPSEALRALHPEKAMNWVSPSEVSVVHNISDEQGYRSDMTNGDNPTNLFEKPSRHRRDVYKAGKSKPYVIGKTDYLNSDRGFPQTTLTYYADGGLADEHDESVEFDNVGGEENLTFGVLSEDQNVVYIRNEGLGQDYEVVRSPMSYKTDVLGLE